MRHLRTRGARTSLAIAAAAALIAFGALPAAADHLPAGSPSPSWAIHLAAAKDALSREDVGGAVLAWHEAYLAALSIRCWEGMLAVGTAYLEIGRYSDSRQSAEAKARQNYLVAFFRAQAMGSVNGLLRVTEAFAALGDREVVAVGVRIATELASDEQGRERVREAAARLGARRLGAMGLDIRAF